MRVYLGFFIIILMLCIVLTGCGQNPPEEEIPETILPAVVVISTATAEPTATASLNSTAADAAAGTKTANPTTARLSTTKPATTKPAPANTTARNGSLRGYVIGIDPGHQGKGNPQKEPVAPGSSETKAKVSSGTQGKWTKEPEYKVVLNVGLQLKALLEKEGATVVMSRQTHDVDISNAQRATMMNEKKTDIVIRIHCNGSDNQQVYGACMLIPSGSNNKSIHSVSEKAGKIILESFIKETGAKDNGLIKRSDLSGFNWSTVPVCLIEMGYMSNKDEDYKLASAEYQTKCAQGLYKGIKEYLIK